jgi:hypothetical protein
MGVGEMARRSRAILLDFKIFSFQSFECSTLIPPSKSNRESTGIDENFFGFYDLITGNACCGAN